MVVAKSRSLTCFRGFGMTQATLFRRTREGERGGDGIRVEIFRIGMELGRFPAGT